MRSTPRMGALLAIAAVATGCRQGGAPRPAAETVESHRSPGKPDVAVAVRILEGNLPAESGATTRIRGMIQHGANVTIASVQPRATGAFRVEDVPRATQGAVGEFEWTVARTAGGEGALRVEISGTEAGQFFSLTRTIGALGASTAAGATLRHDPDGTPHVSFRAEESVAGAAAAGSGTH